MVDGLKAQSKFKWMARFGFVTRGLLYIVIALLVISTGRRNSRIGQSRSSAALRSALSGLTAVGWPTASSIGRSVIESL